MFQKGELLLSYDEGDIYKQEIEDIKENWSDYAEEHGKEPTDKTLETIVWNRLSDGWRYQDEWGFFKEALTHLMTQLNPNLEWESPDSKEQYDGEDGKFSSDKGEDLLHKFVDFDTRNGISYINIFAYGKDGFCIDPEWQTEKCVLSACKTGFYRDWNKEGVCVATVESED
jgi:hypothetical protein